MTMHSHDPPGFIIDALRDHDLSDQDYYLYASGRALGFVRMAATALDELDNELKVAEYHAYAGVSAARSALDAAANWLRVALNMGIGPSTRIDFAKDKFRQWIGDACQEIAGDVNTLGVLAKQIDRERQRAQHREGLVMIFYNSGDWYISQGPRDNPSNHKHCPTLMRDWANSIEIHLQGIVRAIPN